MKKITLMALFALAIGFGCENKRDTSNMSTPTEKNGSGEGDHVTSDLSDSADINAHQASDSAELSTGAPEENK